jgi:FixJ family two-component response regulator
MPPREVAIVDDDIAILQSLRFLLETAGHAVATYDSAQGFLARGGAQTRCILLDQRMPSMTGLALAATLRQGRAIAPMLLMTAAPTPSVLAWAARLGIKQVLQKPVPEGAILAFVESCR